MSLERVEVTREVLLACLCHAHSTEAEEVMGLLLGDIQDTPSGLAVCRVSLAFPQIRTDRRKDRVESSPEQMARCTAHAERLSRESGTRTRVVGWYHSHPHITVLPSHVDVRTQAMYQLLDPGFVGLIISTFNRDTATEACTVQLTAFQSLPDDTVSSGAAAGGPMVRKEVPVSVVPARNPLERSFSDVLVVQRILLLEEQEVHRKAVEAAEAAAGAPAATAGNGGAADGGAAVVDLQQLHHACVYQAHLSRLVETSLRPTVSAMAARVLQQRHQLRQLQQQVAELEAAMAPGGAAALGGAPAQGVNVSLGGVPPMTL